MNIPVEDWSPDFVIDESTGGVPGGMPPGTVYLYSFDMPAQ